MASSDPDKFFHNAINRLTRTGSPCEIYWVMQSGHACIRATEVMMKRIKRKHKSTDEIVSMATNTEILFKSGSRFRSKVHDIYQFNTLSRISITVPWEDYLHALKHEDELIAVRKQLEKAEQQIQRLEAELEHVYRPGNAGAIKAGQHFNELATESLDEDAEIVK